MFYFMHVIITYSLIYSYFYSVFIHSFICYISFFINYIVYHNFNQSLMKLTSKCGIHCESFEIYQSKLQLYD